jgi:hypothetical protein
MSIIPTRSAFRRRRRLPDSDSRGRVSKQEARHEKRDAMQVIRQADVKSAAKREHFNPKGTFRNEFTERIGL